MKYDCYWFGPWKYGVWTIYALLVNYIYAILVDFIGWGQQDSTIGTTHFNGSPW